MFDQPRLQLNLMSFTLPSQLGSFNISSFRLWLQKTGQLSNACPCTQLNICTAHSCLHTESSQLQFRKHKLHGNSHFPRMFPALRQFYNLQKLSRKSSPCTQLIIFTATSSFQYESSQLHFQKLKLPKTRKFKTNFSKVPKSETFETSKLTKKLKLES
jgi:hypothetical protein